MDRAGAGSQREGEGAGSQREGEGAGSHTEGEVAGSGAPVAAAWSVEERRRRRQEIRAFTDHVRSSFVSADHDNTLAQHDSARAALAIKDIVKSRRLPFSTAVVEERLPYIARAVMSGKESTPQRTRLLSAGNSLCSGAPSGAGLTPSLSRSVAASQATSARTTPRILSTATSMNGVSNTGKSLMSNATLPESSVHISSRRVDAMLQEVLELMTAARTSVNPSKLMFEAALAFDELKMFDRAAYCYGRASFCADAGTIIDTEVLPQDARYLRKVERMSPQVLPTFLAERNLLRSQLVFEESERQRLRKMAAHMQLTRLHLMTSVKDLYQAHNHLIRAFECSSSEDEHEQLLQDFHGLLVLYSHKINGKADFTAHKQVLRGSAGPIADDHLTILLDLLKYHPDDPVLHDWTAMRFAEKCDFDNSQKHFKIARDLREDSALSSHIDPLGTTYTGENNQLLIEQRTERLVNSIAQNVRKMEVKEYGVSAPAESERDYAWFRGRHEDSTVKVYVPPPQGWG